jgi:hypothetical protein
MKLTRDNFRELLEPIHKKIIADTYAQLPEQYTQVVTVGDMDKKTVSYPHIGAFGKWKENTEGNTINETEIHEGDVAYFTARRFDDGYSVTWELTRDNLYGSTGVLAGFGKGGSAQALARGLRATVETEAAAPINNGFTNVGYDGVPLFSDSHPLTDSNLLGDNLVTGPLNPENVKTGMTKLRNTLNEAGIKIPARAKQLVVGPDNEFTALEILKSVNQAYELSNTANVIEGIRPIVWDYIEGNIWMLRDPEYENIKLMWRDRPRFDSMPLPKTVDWFMYGYTRFDTGYMDWRGIVGSTGEAS